MSINDFLKVIIATQRAKQIRKGARALVQSSSTKATRIALEEAEQGLIGACEISEVMGETKSAAEEQVDQALKAQEIAVVSGKPSCQPIGEFSRSV